MRDPYFWVKQSNPMASVKIQYFTKKTYADGSHPVRVRVIQKRKQAIKTLFAIHPKYWQDGQVKSSHKHSNQYNATISKELHRCRERIMQFEAEGKDFDAGDILYDLHGGSTLVEALKGYSKDLDHRASRKYHNIAGHIENFRPHTTIAQVDVVFLEKLRKYLLSLDAIGSDTTVRRYINAVKTALRAQRKLGNFSNDAVFEYSAPAGSTSKVPLTREEFKAITEVDVQPLTRDVFCLLVYFRGIRIGDLLQMLSSEIQNGRAVFKEQKTQKLQNIKIIPEAQEIIDRYAGNEYVLPVLKMQRPARPREDRRFLKHIEAKTSLINRNLKIIAAAAGIEKPLTTHIARHTFGSWADRSGLTSREIQKIFNHSSLAVTEGYLEDLRRSSELDDAVDRVFG